MSSQEHTADPSELYRQHDVSTACNMYGIIALGWAGEDHEHLAYCDI